MSNQSSLIAHCGSQFSTPSAESTESAAQHHIPARMRAISDSWLRIWLREDQRHERILTATPRAGVAVLTRAMMEMHIQQTPSARGTHDYLPVAHRTNAAFVGWRKKLGTWEAPKRQPLSAW